MGSLGTFRLGVDSLGGSRNLLGPLTFLQLGQLATQRCGANNVTLTTMQDQTGESQRFVQWTGDAWIELQTLHDDWEWMKSSQFIGGGVAFIPQSGQSVCSFGTAAGDLGITSNMFGKWDVGSFRNYTTSAGVTSEIFMTHIKKYQAWFDAYEYGANRNVKTRPVAFAVGPNYEICVGPPSNGLYTVTGDFYFAPTPMIEDSDTPLGLPDEHYLAIVGRVMMYYADYESAPEVMNAGQKLWNRHIFELERQRGPRTRGAAALA